MHARTHIRRFVALPLGAAVLASSIALLAAGQAPASAPEVIKIDAARPGPAIAPGMFGVFFEDINFAADGGLYPERVKNRSFEFTEPLTGWRKRDAPVLAAGELAVRSDRPVERHQPALRAPARFTSGTGSASRTRVPRNRASRRAPSTSCPRTSRVRERQPASRCRHACLIDARRALGAGALSGFPASGRATRPRSRRAARTRQGTTGVDRRRRGRGRPRHGLALPEGDLEGPAERAARGPGPAARRPEARLPPLPRRLHRRRATPGDALPVEEDDRRPSRTPAARSTAGTTSSRTGPRRTTTSRSAWASSSTSSSRRTSAPSRCRSSTAAWRASSTRASWCRSTSSTRTSRTRST